MSLFRIFKGSASELKNLNKTKEGYAYYTSDDSHLYIDSATSESNVKARKKVIGLSQVNHQFILTVEDWDKEGHLKEQDIINPVNLNDYFKAEGFAYIVSPTFDSATAYAEAGIRAKDPLEGSMTFTYQEKPIVPITVNILRVEEDPYYGEK